MFRSVFVAPIVCAVLVLALAVPSHAREGPAAKPSDVGSIDDIITALYDVISGPIGEMRDRQRFMSLFVEGARLIPTGQFRVMSPEEYWAGSSDQLRQIGFTEKEIGRTTETFGNIAHAFTAYASYRADQGDPDTPFSRGINSVQLLNDGQRWWIVSVFWDAERPGNQIPGRYIN